MAGGGGARGQDRNCQYGQGQLMLISITFLAGILQSCLHHDKPRNHFYRQFCHSMVTQSYPCSGVWLETGQAGMRSRAQFNKMCIETLRK